MGFVISLLPAFEVAQSDPELHRRAPLSLFKEKSDFFPNDL